jgi:hypothetical protein
MEVYQRGYTSNGVVSDGSRYSIMRTYHFVITIVKLKPVFSKTLLSNPWLNKNIPALAMNLSLWIERGNILPPQVQVWGFQSKSKYYW